MANETKNRQHAIGTFVGAEPVAAPFTSRIVNAVGVDSFTRNSVGNYTAVLHDAIAFAGATVRADLPANFLGIVGAQLAPDGASVLVTVFDLSGAPADAPLVALEVVSVVQGEGADGPAPVLPGPPAPGGGGLLMGWGRCDAAANLQAQSSNGIISGVVVFGLGTFQWDLIAGLPPIAAAVVTLTTTAGNVGADLLANPASLFVRTGASNVAHWAFFYSA